MCVCVFVRNLVYMNAEQQFEFTSSLLLQELPYSCVEVVCEPQLLAGIVKMLRVTQAFVCASPDNFTPQ